MNAESFSNEDIGALMNANFIAIKVDREERPDVDSTYMAVARKLMSDPGWPLNVILTPDGKPFFAAAYIPKDRLQRTPHEPRQNLERTPRTDRLDRIDGHAIARAGINASADIPGAELLKKTYQQFADRFDAVNGGFNPPPKLPAAHQLMFLLRYWRRTGEPHALEMVETTLQKMRAGAIWDAKRGGFHRYAVDAEWNQPHYEKMLCDQAMLAMAYLEAFQATHKPEYAATARAIFAYVLRDLRAPNGAFYSRQRFRRAHRPRRKNPHRLERPDDRRARRKAPPSSTTRPTRSPPAAPRMSCSTQPRLRHSDKQQTVFLDDYTFLTWGLLNLYEATFEVRYLEKAIALERESLTRFRDATGRFYLTTSDDLLLRPRETSDGALPSGNSVQLMNLVRLARITGDAVLRKSRQRSPPHHRRRSHAHPLRLRPPHERPRFPPRPILRDRPRRRGCPPAAARGVRVVRSEQGRAAQRRGYRAHRTVHESAARDRRESRPRTSARITSAGCRLAIRRRSASYSKMYHRRNDATKARQ